MTTRLATLATSACCACCACLLALARPTAAAAQAPRPDSVTAAPNPKDLPLTAAERQALVGRYFVTLPHGLQVHVRVFEDSGSLRLRPEEPDQSQAARLLHQGGYVFVPEGIPDFVLEFVVERGRAERLRLRKEDGPGHGVRVP